METEENDISGNTCEKCELNFDNVILMTKKGENIVRTLTQNISPTIKKVIGAYYYIIHGLVVGLGGFILFFSRNKFYLTFVLIIAVLDSLCIVVLHDCPLTWLERKYMGTSSVELRNSILTNMGIVFKCDHLYETQLELLINIWSYTCIKLCIIIIMEMLGLSFTQMA